MQKILAKKNIQVLNHPIIEHNLAVLRDENYDPERFRVALQRVIRLLMYEGTRSLPVVEKELTTPVANTRVNVLDEDIEIILAPILRAGLVFCDAAQDILPMASIQHLGMYRDHETLQPVWYYNKTFKDPKNAEDAYVFVLDPMIATGNSLCDALELYVSKNIPQKNITCISLISAPEGLSKATERFPDIKIVTAAIDLGLNAKGYIIPGLGDAGDKAFNTLV